MRRKRLICMGAVMAMAAVIFCGCGNKDTKDNGATKAVSGGGTSVANTLKDAYKSYFPIGVAINTSQLEDEEYLSVIKQQFNSITMENEMKPESLLDQEGCEKSSDGMPVIYEDKLAQILTLAKDNGLKVRAHTLVWHNQTPNWFFCKNYQDGEQVVDKDTMLKRMEGYIKAVMTYCQNNYPGIIYAWDVVNEAVADGVADYRSDKSMWYEVVGEEFVEKAFTYAKKYVSKDAKLFYNDYNSYEAQKRDFIYAMVKKLADKKLVDGIGMQSHWSLDTPQVDVIETGIEKYATLGLEIQLTEIDMHTTENDEATMKKQAARYKEIFQMLVKQKKENKANITGATFWGLDDGVTWLTNFKGEDSYPLLFDSLCRPKPALQSIIDAAK